MIILSCFTGSNHENMLSINMLALNLEEAHVEALKLPKHCATEAQLMSQRLEKYWQGKRYYFHNHKNNICFSKFLCCFYGNIIVS